MGTVSTSTFAVSDELTTAVKRVRAAGWTWRDVEDAGGPSSTIMSRILNGSQVRVRTDVLKQFDTAFDWPGGTAIRLVHDQVKTRRGALTDAVVGPPGQSANIAKAGDRGKELMQSEREIVGEAAALLAKAAELLASIAKPEPNGD